MVGVGAAFVLRFRILAQSRRRFDLIFCRKLAGSDGIQITAVLLASMDFDI
jgi:hypothetical protein